MTSDIQLAATMFGLACQRIKAEKGFPTWGAQILTILACAACYALYVAVPDAQNWRAWMRSVTEFGFMALGIGSFAAATGLVAKTDSIH